jgi:hypothetical protein
MVSEKERFIGYNWFNIKEINKIQTLFDISSIIMKNKTFFI